MVSGDYLGCMIDLDTMEAQFYLNGIPLDQPHTAVFDHAGSGGLNLNKYRY